MRGLFVFGYYIATVLPVSYQVVPEHVNDIANLFAETDPVASTPVVTKFVPKVIL